MKKFLLAAALLFAFHAVFADDFDDFVKGMKEDGGLTVRADKPHRMIFLDTRFETAASLTEEQIAEIKSELLKALAGDTAAVIKALNVTIVVNYIMKDGSIHSVVIASGDL